MTLLPQQIQDAIEQIVVWTKLKCRIQSAKRSIPYFREREVWWVHLGENIGSEQNGKNAGFDRPALIIKKFGPEHLWILPITTSERGGHYLFPTSHVFDGKRSKISMSQIRTISSKRLIQKAWTIPEDEYRQIIDRLQKILFRVP